MLVSIPPKLGISSFVGYLKEAGQLEQGLNSYFGLIEKLPDSVTNNGIDSGVKWLNQNKGQDYKGYKYMLQTEIFN